MSNEITISRSLAYATKPTPGVFIPPVAEIGDRKWWGVRVYATNAGIEALGLPGFLGGIVTRSDLGKSRYSARFSDPTNKVDLGVFKSRSAAFKALIEYHASTNAATTTNL